MKFQIKDWHWLIGIGVTTVILAWAALPEILNWLEIWLALPLNHEQAIRVLFVLFLGIGLVGMGLWLVYFPSRKNLMIITVAGVLVFLDSVVLGLDQKHILMEEYSWIRYPTASFLTLTGLSLLIFAWRHRKERTVSWLVCLAATALFYAAVDEIFEIHEAIGRSLMKITGISEITDYITIGYAILVISAAIFGYYIRRLYSLSPFSFKIWGLAAFVYLFSTLLDTFDTKLLSWLRWLAKVWSAQGYIFSDYWYPLWAVKPFLNGLEELLESVAAAIFFAGAWYLVMGDTPQILLRIPKKVAIFFNISSGAVSSFLVLAIIMGYSGNLDAVKPITGDLEILAAAGPFDGLFHTDDLYFHPKWGILIGNEGKGNVYQITEAGLRRIPDLKKQLADPDSLTADDKAIYVSSGSKGIIYQYTEEKGYEPIWTKSNGLVRPEGIAADGKALYVLEEKNKTLTRLVKGEKPEVWRPKYDLWQAPEGLVFDKQNRRLIVTDDKSGAVFGAKFNETVELITKFKAPEDVEALTDGRLLVTDNSFGAVFQVSLDGSVQKRVQFRRMYRDLQGLAVDASGNLWVVSSDGPDSASFMPSFLWLIKWQNENL